MLTVESPVDIADFFSLSDEYGAINQDDPDYSNQKNDPYENDYHFLAEGEI